MTRFIFDIEMYPNFFSLIAVPETKGDDTAVVFEWSQRRDDRVALAKWCKHKTLVGYNNLGYDNIVLNHVLNNPASPADTHAISQNVIKNDNWGMADTIKRLRYAKNGYESIDLSRIVTGNGGHFPSLKQIAIHLEWPRLQELPYDPHKPLSFEQMDVVLDYNLNDVLITKQLYFALQGGIAMREETGKLFDVDLVNSSESAIGDAILVHKLGGKSDTNTPRQMVMGRDIISPKVKFSTPSLIALAQSVANSNVLQGFSDVKSNATNTLTAEVDGEIYNYDIARSASKGMKVVLGGVTFNLGLGGLHSDDDARLFRADSDTILRDADVTSYYPNIALTHNYEPEHLKGRFIPVYRAMVDERTAAKKEGDEIKAWVLKIAVNGIFGKFNFSYSWLYDPKVFFAITINGQLFLLMFIERLIAAGIEVVSANTDGVVCRFSPAQEAAYVAVCKQWESETDFNLEYTDYKVYVRRDVNNYLSLTSTGKMKGKGALAVTRGEFAKGYDKPIVPMAIKAYFIDGIPVEDTVRNCQNIHLFCATKKIGEQFIPIFRTADGMEEVVQRRNRYYAVKAKGGILMKRQFGGKLLSVTTQQVYLANNITDNMPEPDYDYYIGEANKIIEQIEPRMVQRGLFG